ncbi:Uncharacterised protein [Yersinia enterocolitica]|nr:Uncharacterised protein [Yersinia enterocolitica]
MVARMSQVAQCINAIIQRTGSHFMEQRFPQMAVVTIHQNNLSFFAAPQLMTQTRCQLKAASTTTNNNDFFLRRCQNDPLNVNQLLAKGK